MQHSNKTWRNIGWTILILIILIQLVPVSKVNSPVTAEMNLPTDIKIVFQRSCYDCHSNETTWPWYSHVAPVSWLVASDVSEGRKELNFSEWNKYSEQRKNKKINEIVKEIEKGDMPMPMYTFIHKNAKISREELTLIKNWANRYKNDTLISNK